MTHAYIVVRCAPELIVPIRRAIHRLAPAGSGVGCADVLYREDRPAPFYMGDGAYAQRLERLRDLVAETLSEAKAEAARQREIDKLPVWVECSMCHRKLVSLTGKPSKLMRMVRRHEWRVSTTFIRAFFHCPEHVQVGDSLPAPPIGIHGRLLLDATNRGPWW